MQCQCFPPNIVHPYSQPLYETSRTAFYTHIHPAFTDFLYIVISLGTITKLYTSCVYSHFHVMFSYVPTTLKSLKYEWFTRLYTSDVIRL